MAKKAKRKLDEDGELKSFQFPEFDERKFLRHEFEQTYATGVALVFAIGLGFLSWGADQGGLPLVVAVLLGVGVVVFSPFVIQRLRPASEEYTKGDWAGLLMLEIFGWLGFWFLLLEVLHA